MPGYHNTLPRRVVDFYFPVFHDFVLFCSRHSVLKLLLSAQCLGIGFLIINYLIFPKCDAGDIGGRLHIAAALRIVEFRNLPYAGGDGIHDLEIVRVVPVHHGYARMLLAIVVPDPDSEAGEAGGEGRYGKGEALERRIAPRLVVGWEYGSVKTYEQVVVAHIEYAVRAVQIRRHEIYFHFVAGGIAQALVGKSVEHLVPGRVHKGVAALCHVLLSPVA